MKKIIKPHRLEATGGIKKNLTKLNTLNKGAIICIVVLLKDFLYFALSVFTLSFFVMSHWQYISHTANAAANIQILLSIILITINMSKWRAI